MKNTIIVVLAGLCIALLAWTFGFNHLPVTPAPIVGETVASNINLTDNYIMAGNSLGYAEETSKFTVDIANGNTTVAGTMGVTGATTLTGALTLNGGIAGTVGASSTGVADAAAILSAADFCDNDLLIFTVNMTAFTLTTDTAAAMIADCLVATGTSHMMDIEVASSSTAVITLAAGTSVDLQEPEDGGSLVIEQNNHATIDCRKVTYADVFCKITEWDESD